ncbi:hypothetical protein SANTM175S_10587 [Streptomyces antimycoticus]
MSPTGTRCPRRGTLAAEGEPVRSVFHAAGIAQNTALEDMTAQEFQAVTSAKVAGAEVLDHLLRDSELDAFVVFSSISAIWGSAQSGAYAAGDAYLDALVERRRARGAAGTSVAWGIWADAGMVDAGTADVLRRIGLGAIPPERAIASLQRTLDAGQDTVTVADVDWEPFAAGYTAARRRPLIEDLEQVRALREGARTADTAAAEDFRARLGPSVPTSGRAPCWTWPAPRPPPNSVCPTPSRWRPTAPSATWASTPWPRSACASDWTPGPVRPHR